MMPKSIYPAMDSCAHLRFFHGASRFSLTPCFSGVLCHFVVTVNRFNGFPSTRGWPRKDLRCALYPPTNPPTLPAPFEPGQTRSVPPPFRRLCGHPFFVGGKKLFSTA